MQLIDDLISGVTGDEDDMSGLDCLGCEEVGFDYGGLLQAAGGVAQYGVSAAEQAKKESESKADDERKTAAIIAADQAAAIAMAKADVSAQLKGPSAAIDAQAAQLAITAQDRAAAAGLSADAQKKRADAADATLANVVKAAQAKPNDINQAALVKAWNIVANKAHSGAIAGLNKPGSGFDSYGGQSWFTRPVLGKVPGYGVLLIGAGALGAGWLVVKKFFLKKVGG